MAKEIYQMNVDEYLTHKGIEKEGLSADAMAGHFNDLNKAKAEKISDLDKQLSEVQGGSEELRKEHDSLRKDFEQLRGVQIEEMQKALKAQGLALEKGIVMRGESVSDVSKALNDNKELLKKMAKEKSQDRVLIRVKRSDYMAKAATDTITQSGSISGGDIPQAYRRDGVVEIMRRQRFIRNWITVIPQTESNIIEWTEQVNLFENTGGAPENTAKQQMALEWVVRREEAKMRAVWIKASNQALNRIDYMNDQINRVLRDSLENDEELQILFGTGAGEDFRGIFTVSTAYDAQSFAGQYPNADYYTVLRTAINQVLTAPQPINGLEVPTGMMPTVVVVSPTAMATMDLTEATDGHYKLPPFMGSGNVTVSGVPVIASNFLSDDQFLVMDGRAVEYYPYESLDIMVGFENDDFTKNLRTIRAEHSALVVVPVLKRVGIITGTFSAAITALSTP